MNQLPTPFGKSPNLPSGPGIPSSLAGVEERANLTSPLEQYFRLFWRHRWLIVIVTSLFLAAGIALSATAQRIFYADSRIQIDRASRQAVEVEAIDTDRTTDWEFYETQYELLKSRRLSEKVVDSLALDSDPNFLFGEDGTDAMLDQIDADRRREQAITLVNASTSVSPVPNSSIVDLGFRSPDPQTAAAVANALAEQFIEMDLEQRFAATVRLRDFLSQKLAETREKLEESERQAAEYARQRGLVATQENLDGTARGSVNTATLEQLNLELAAATARRVQAESALRSNRGGQAADTALNNQAISNLREQRGILSAELSKLESDFGPEYPRVVALRSQVAELDRQIGREQSRVGSSVSSRLRDEFDGAVAAESALRSRVARAKGAVLDDQQQEIGLKIIQRDIDTNRELYDGLLEQYKIVGVAGASGSNRISIVDRADVPGGPSSPNIPFNIAFALLLGLGSSVGWILVREQLRRSRLTPDDLSSKLQLPLLGHTPKVRQDRNEGGREEDRLALAEAYYSTLTALRFQQEQGLPPSLFVTSSRQYEGKSTSTAALARDLANSGMSVLLIDADLRSPSVHKMVKMPLDTGTSDYLAGRSGLDGLVRETDMENLHVMFAGTPPPNPAQLLATDRMRQLIEDATARFDHVVIDGPPVLGLADAPLIARAAHGTVFVVESNKTQAATARAAIDRLVAVNARIIGALMTKYDPQRDGYGYSYSDGYGYGSPYGYGQ